MFLEFYGLQEDPFTLPIPRYIYLGLSYRKALASLHYGIEFGRGIHLLLANSGMGKTTLLRSLQGRTQAYAHTIFLSAIDCKEADFSNCFSDDLKGLTETAFHLRQNETVEIGSFAEETNERSILLVDDAQELDNSKLESLFSLTELAALRKRHLYIVLAGHPKLLEKLKLSRLPGAFSQTWIAPLSSVEVEEYINHRFRLAVGNHDLIFTSAAHGAIARRSAGIPDQINSICATALMTGAKNRLKQIDTPVIDADDSIHRAANAILSAPRSSLSYRRSHVNWLLLILSFVIAVTGLWYENSNRSRWKLGVTENQTEHLPVLFSGVVPQSAPASNNPEDGGSNRVSTGKRIAVGELEILSATSNVTYNRAITPTTLNRAALGLTSHDRASLGTASIPTLRISSPRIAAGPQFRSGANITLPPSRYDNSATRVQLASPPAPRNIVRAGDIRQVRIQTDVGDDFMRLGEYDKALSFYKDALALSPGNEELERKILRAVSAKSTEEQILPP
jgi:type II secretory pathway predicted ATPase ExeA